MSSINSNVTCDNYQCEGGMDHTHIGVQSHLRRVISHGKLIDGATEQEPVIEGENDDVNESSEVLA